MKKIFIACVLSLFIFSCKEKIDLELDSSYTRLVVEGYITEETKAHTVKLSLSADYLANQAAVMVQGANVTLIEKTSSGENTFVLSENTPGQYQTLPTFKGTIGNSYKILIDNVTIDGKTQSYESEFELLHNPIPVDSCRAEYNAAFDEWSILVSFRDRASTKDNYMFRYSINGIPQNDTISSIPATSDEFFNGMYISAIALHRNIPTLHRGDIVTEEMSIISKEYLAFAQNINSSGSSGIPLFSGPPANVKGNINKGALGYFTAYSTSRANFVIK